MNELGYGKILAIGSRVENYAIEGVLGAGGFGITYAAHDLQLDKPVALKEYLPAAFAIRGSDMTVTPASESSRQDYEWGMNAFLEEGRTLAKFDHRHLNKVLAFLETNGTAYLVLERIFGQTLSALLGDKGKLDDEQTQLILHEVGLGLHCIHQSGFLHRDVKPGNIMFRDSDDSAVLLDFGSARQLLSERTSLMTTVLTPGYAPAEQYLQNSTNTGPWTDLYSLGMVGYRCVTGITDQQLVHAPDREKKALGRPGGHDMPSAEEAAGPDGYDKRLLWAIDWAMSPLEENRPQSVEEWFDKWGENKQSSNPVPPPIPRTPVAPVVETTQPPPISRPPPVSARHNAGTVTPAPFPTPPGGATPARPAGKKAISTATKSFFFVAFLVAIGKAIISAGDNADEQTVVTDNSQSTYNSQASARSETYPWTLKLDPIASGTWTTIIEKDLPAWQKILNHEFLPDAKLLNFRYKSMEAYGETKKGVSLLEFQLRNGSTSSSGPIHFYATQDLDTNIRYALDGSSPPIHKMNKDVKLSLKTSEQAVDYLRFFNSAVTANEGNPFFIPPAGSVVKLKDGTELLITPIDLQKNTDGSWSTRSPITISYQNNIFTADYKIETDGMIAMLSDTPVGEQHENRSVIVENTGIRKFVE